MIDEHYEEERRAQQSSDFKLTEFLKDKKDVPIIKEQHYLENIRKSTKPIYQKVRFLLVLFLISGSILGLGLGFGLAKKAVTPTPPPTHETVGQALNSQFQIWNYASSSNCLAIQLDPEHNVFLKGSARVNTYAHSFHPSASQKNITAGSIKNDNIYLDAFQLFNVRAITSYKPVSQAKQLTNNTANPNLLVRLVGGNIFGESQYEIHIASSLSFGSQLPWDKQNNDVDNVNLCSKQLEATMHFSYDANAKDSVNPISKITFKSLAESNSKTAWLQNYNFQKQKTSTKSVYLPLLQHAGNQPGDTKNTTSFNNIYDDAYQPFTYEPGVNKLDDSYFNQPTSYLNPTPLFNDILFPKTGFSLQSNVFGTGQKAGGFIGVKTPYVFSSDFVKSAGINKSLDGSPFFSNLMFSKLKLNALKAEAIIKNGLSPNAERVFGTYSKQNPLYSGDDSWTLTGVSPYYGLKNQNGLLFPQSKTNPINISEPNKIGTGNQAPSRGDSTDIHNLVSPTASETTQLSGSKMVYPGFSYNSLPFYNFGTNEQSHNIKSPFSEYNLGLYHSADLGNPINQMTLATNTSRDSIPTNTSVANIVNGLGMANISFGDSNNPYKLPDNNSKTVNMFDQLLNIMTKAQHGGKYSLQNSSAKSTNGYKVKGMPLLSNVINSYTLSKNLQNIFFSPYLGSDNKLSKTAVNNYLMAIMPRLILKSYMLFIPYSGTNLNHGSVTHFNTDAKRWALALIMPTNKNLITANPVAAELSNNLLPALKIHNFEASTASNDLLSTDPTSLINPDGTPYKLSFQVNSSDSLPQPTNWWASMDDRSIFKQLNGIKESDPTLIAMCRVGVASSYLEDEFNIRYPGLSMVYNNLDTDQFSTMSPHPGSFSWIPFNLFRN